MANTTKHSRTPSRGFTLIEVLIVLAIILLLAGLVGVSFFNRRDQADIDIVKINLNTINSALDQFRFDFRRYPTDEEGVTVLWEKERLDPEADAARWSGPYVTQPMPADQWANAWGYAQQTEEAMDPSGDDQPTTPRFDLWSNGPDGQEGTEDDIRVGRSAASSTNSPDGSTDELLGPSAP